MWTRIVASFLIVASLTAARAKPDSVRDSATPAPNQIVALVTSLRHVAHERDSLSARADSATGTSRDFLEELVWQRHVQIHAGVLEIASEVKAARGRGEDLTEVQRTLDEAVRDEWPGYLDQLRRRGRRLNELMTTADAATGAQRLALETEITRQTERIVEAYRSLVETVQALGPLGVDVSEQRVFLVHDLPVTADRLVTRVQLANRDRVSAAARLSRDASNADLRYASEAAEERFKRAANTLTTAIELMDRLRLETTSLRVDLIAATGRMTADVFHWNVLLGLLQSGWGRLLDLLVVKAPQWLFQGGLVVLTFLAFQGLSKLVRRVVREAVKHSSFSQLLRDTVVRLSSHAVMLIGFLVILTQLGMQVAPLLAGLGIAGFVIGFAMQNTLANFAAGGMILGNQPFDIGDEIEVAGVLGTVKRMTLVSTTILTPDNQTLIIPNSTVWGGVIRNRTAQSIRRVDLTFSIGYGDDLEKAELALREVVAAEQNVLKDPPPVIRLHQLADSSVNFVVRAWTARDQYWNVYWDLTRAVKLRFDQDGITIPFPQRDVNLKVPPGAPETIATPGTSRPAGSDPPS